VGTRLSPQLGFSATLSCHSLGHWAAQTYGGRSRFDDLSDLSITSESFQVGKVMADTRRFRLALFTSIYIVQGVGLAYFSNFQKPYLSSLGISAAAIGALTFALQIPFILKILVGVVSDRVDLLGKGHRRPYMVLGLLLACVAFSSAALVLPERSYLGFAALILLGALSVTVFDSTADGLAVDLTPRNEQGLVQGVMVAGKALAFVALSLLFGALVPRAGYRAVFPIIGLSMLLPLVWVLRVPEPKRRDPTQRFDKAAFGELRQPRFLLFALYAVVYSIGSFGVDGLVTYSLSARFGGTEQMIGRYGALRGLGAAVGAVLAGALIDVIGRRRSSLGTTLLISVGAALFAVAGSAGAVVRLGFGWGVFWAFQETVFFALAMDIADKRIAASMFAVMMALSNLGAAAADGIATALSGGTRGFAAVFWGLAAINLLTLPVLLRLFRQAPELAGSRGRAKDAQEAGLPSG